jgi:pimeloyl-ACP methyl ester carboxylesterase/AcrR family transcriptional regulator
MRDGQTGAEPGRTGSAQRGGTGGAERGRPAKRVAVTRAATAVFLREGFGDATIDAIAAEAGVAKQTIYNHFGDKEQLFRAVMAEAQQDLGTRSGLPAFEEWLSGSGDLRADLRAYGRAALPAVVRPDIAALRRLVIAEWNRHPELLAEWAAPRAAFEESLARAIHRQAQRGTLDVPDPALAARQLNMVTIHEAMIRSLFGVRALGDEEISEIVDTGVDMWLRAYGYREPPAASPASGPGAGETRSPVGTGFQAGAGSPAVTGTADSGGARIYYERRGDGPPLLLIAGGGGDCGFYSAMADLLAGQYTVLTYDRRGNSRSPLRDAPAPIRIADQSADALAVLRANGFSSAAVFGNSGGATIALDLAAYHAEAVAVAVVHEPPVPRVLPDAGDYLAIYDEIDRLLATEGWEAAFGHFQTEVGHIPPGQQRIVLNALLHPETVIPPGPLLDTMTRVSRNWAYMTAYEIRPFIDYRPDLDRIAAGPARVVLGYGSQTTDPVVVRMSTVTAERLGADCVRFPGGHTAAMERAAEFAAGLRRVLAQP